MLVSANIIIFPKEVVLENFEKNNLQYFYKNIMELDTSNLWAEIIYETSDKVAYIIPEDFNEEMQMFITKQMIDFTNELNLKKEGE